MIKYSIKSLREISSLRPGSLLMSKSQFHFHLTCSYLTLSKVQNELLRGSSLIISPLVALPTKTAISNIGAVSVITLSIDMKGRAF